MLSRTTHSCLSFAAMLTLPLGLAPAIAADVNILFVLQANKPVSGSIFFDKIGFMVR